MALSPFVDVHFHYSTIPHGMTFEDLGRCFAALSTQTDEKPLLCCDLLPCCSLTLRAMKGCKNLGAKSRIEGKINFDFSFLSVAQLLF